MWVYEIALLFSDQPPALRALISNSNYNLLLEKEIVANENQYYVELGRQVNLFANTDFRSQQDGAALLAIRVRYSVYLALLLC